MHSGYKEDKKHNLGTYTHADGSVYTGEYKKGKPSGRGIYTFPTGEKFEGEFMGGYKVLREREDLFCGIAMMS